MDEKRYELPIQTVDATVIELYQFVDTPKICSEINNAISPAELARILLNDVNTNTTNTYALVYWEKQIIRTPLNVNIFSRICARGKDGILYDGFGNPFAEYRRIIDEIDPMVKENNRHLLLVWTPFQLDFDTT